jgi:hypothetical protein
VMAFFFYCSFESLFLLGGWKFLHVRVDKSTANDKETVSGIFKSIQENIGIDEIDAYSKNQRVFFFFFFFCLFFLFILTFYNLEVVCY